MPQIAPKVSGELIILPPEEVQEWLEWAGARLLSMHLSGGKPKGYKSAWPEYPTDFRQAYGYTEERLRPALPSSEEITLMDEILLLPELIEDPMTRRIVMSRALVTPISQRYVYSWTRLAKFLHTERRKVAALHRKGLALIAEDIPVRKVYRLRAALTPLKLPA